MIRDPAIKTGLTVSITSARDRALVTYLGSIAALREDAIQDAWFEGCRHLHVSSFFMQKGLRPGLKRLLTRAHGFGLTTSIDPGFDPAEAWEHDLLDALEETDLFLPNEVELSGATGIGNPAEALRALDNGHTRTVVKLGAAGSATLENGEVLRVPAFAIEPLDTTGAGDSFNAGFLDAWLRGRSILESMRIGAACGALSTQGLGGTAAQPSESQVEEFLAANSPEPAVHSEARL